MDGGWMVDGSGAFSAVSRSNEAGADCVGQRHEMMQGAEQGAEQG